jgi:cytidine deaminase
MDCVEVFSEEDLKEYLTEEQISKMKQLSILAKEESYSPYSKFRVGCCLLTDDGKYFKGTNVENISYGLTICSERAAVCNAIVNGCRKIKACMVTTDMDYFVSPCGACRQVLVEFDTDICIFLTKLNELNFIKGQHLLPIQSVIKHLKQDK